MYYCEHKCVIVPSHVRTIYVKPAWNRIKYRLCIPDMCLGLKPNYRAEDERKYIRWYDVLYFPVKDGKKYFSPFSNTDSFGSLCFGDFMVKREDFKEVLHNLYNSLWTDDLPQASCEKYIPEFHPCLRPLDNWDNYHKFLCNWEKVGHCELIPCGLINFTETMVQNI